MEPFFSFSFFSILNGNFRVCNAWKICWCSGPRRLLLLNVAIDDEKSKRRAMQTVAGVEGKIHSINQSRGFENSFN